MMNPAIYSHFHPSERPFVDKAWEWINRAAYRHAWKLTDFLDPRQQLILESLANHQADVQVAFRGGYPEAERCRAILTPDYMDPEDIEEQIQVLAIHSGDAKFEHLQHGDFLGALLNLGLKRDKIGDIHVIPEGCHCLVATETAEYLHLHLQQVHRLKVYTELLPLEQLQVVQPNLEEHRFTVSSLRVDAVVSDVYRLSRSKVLEPIKQGRCKVNWKVEQDPSKTLKVGDVVSFQGFGRFRISDIEGTTKKGNLRLVVEKFV